MSDTTTTLTRTTHTEEAPRVVRIFSKPACVQCNATYRALDAKGIDYEVIDVSTDEEGLQHVKDLGYMQAPVVVTDTEHWSGFRPDKIDALAARLA